MTVTPGILPGFDRLWDGDASTAALIELFGPALLGQYRFYDPNVVLNYLSAPGELLLNGGFETGNPGPPANWKTFGGPTLTSQAGARTGGSGSWFARLANVAPATTGILLPTVDVAVVGARLRANGWTRASAAGASAQVKDGGAVLLFATSSLPWIEYDVDYTAVSTEMRLYVFEAGAPASLYTDWDDCSLTELPRIVSVPNHQGLAQRNQALYGDPFHLNQATGANQPWLNPTGWGGVETAGQFNGTNQWMQVDAMAAQFSGTDLPVFALCVVEEASSGQDAAFWHIGNSTTTNPRIDLFDNGAGFYRSIKRDDAGVPATNVTTLATDANRHVVAVMHTGTTVTIWVDGVVTSVNAAASNVGLTTVDQVTLAAFRAIGTSNRLAANFREFVIGTGPVSGPQMVRATNILRNYSPLS